MGKICLKCGKQMDWYRKPSGDIAWWCRDCWYKFIIQLRDGLARTKDTQHEDLI